MSDIRETHGADSSKKKSESESLEDHFRNVDRWISGFAGHTLGYNIIIIMLALIWVSFLHNQIPGNWFLKGFIYGVIISFVAGALVSPLAMLIVCSAR